MLDLICLWIGRIVIGIILLIVCAIVCAIVLRALDVPLRRLWYSIKHLIPCYWITEKHWKEYEDYCHRPETEKNPLIAGVRYWRKGCFGILTFPNEKRWSPKHHLFIIKKG